MSEIEKSANLTSEEIYRQLEQEKISEENEKQISELYKKYSELFNGKRLEEMSKDEAKDFIEKIKFVVEEDKKKSDQEYERKIAFLQRTEERNEKR